MKSLGLRKVMLIMLVILNLSASSQTIFVNEIMFKPGPQTTGCDQKLFVRTPNSSGMSSACGREYIELYNSDCDNDYDLSGYVLGSCQATSGIFENGGAFMFPPGTLIPAGGFLVVGGPDEDDGDNGTFVYQVGSVNIKLSDFQGTDYIATVSNGYWFLPNVDGWMALYEPNGDIHSSVFWSSSSANINTVDEFNAIPPSPAAYSGTTLKSARQINSSTPSLIQYVGPASATSTGNTLSRIPDGGAWQSNRPKTIGIVHSDNCNDGSCFSCGALTLVPSSDVCNTSTGSILATVDGLAVSPPFQYTISGPVSYSITTNDNPYLFENLPAGDYTIEVLDGGGTSASRTTTVESIGGADLTTNSTSDECGQGTGTATVNPTGGTSPYNFLWNDPLSQTTQTATNLLAGVYSVTVTNSDGSCPVSASVPVESAGGVTLNTSTTNATCNLANGTATVIPNENPGDCTYLWSPGGQTGQTATNLTSGNYSVSVTYFGCVSSATLTVVSDDVNLTIAPSVTNETCNMGNGSATAIPSQNPSECTYLWSPGGFTTQTINNLVAGNYSVTVNYFGCTASQSINISNENYSISSSINAQNPLCNGQANGSIAISNSGGNPPYNYLWSNGLTSSSINSLADGLYSVTVNDSWGCTASETVVITEPSALLVSVNNPPIVCANQNVDLYCNVNGGVPPYSYYWSTGHLTSSASISTTVPLSISISVTDQNGCNAGAQTNLTVYALPELSIFVSNDSVCPGTPVNVLGTTGGGAWPLTLYQDGNIVVLPQIIVPSTSQTYSYVLTDNCGNTATSQLNIFTFDLPNAGFSSDYFSGCQPFAVSFTNYSNCLDCSFMWNFDDVHHVNLSLDPNPVHIFNHSGNYDISLTVTDTNGCKNINTINNMIEVFPIPEADFIADPISATMINPLINFSNYSHNASDYYWSFGDGDSSNFASPEHLFQNPGVYNVQLVAVTNKGCSDTISQEILINDETTFYAPNAFTPNNSGINDYFYITGTGISREGFQMIIYDRWGEPIYNTNSFNPDRPQDSGWNGRVKDRKFAESGVYTWLVIYKDVNSLMHEKTGSVTLLR
jgi:gliding motility-associated-like protein